MSDDELRQQALDAISSLVATIDPGAMVSRFVALVEVVDADADRALWCLTPPDAKAWDTLGLLAYAEQIELAAQGDDDDG